MQQPVPSLIAAIDLGSNSFHLVVARIEHGQVRVIDRLQEMVRLGGALDARNRLTKTTSRRALECLQRFGERLRGLPSEAVRVVGTDTLRRARNSEPFLVAAQKALGHPIEIVSGQEEARLIYQGVAHHLPNTDKRRLVIDIGGGSTELILGVGVMPQLAESLSLGCVSLNRAYFANGRINAKAMRAASTAARLECKPIEAQFRAHGWDEAYGSSGAIRAMAAVVQSQKWVEPDEGITAAALEKLTDRITAAGHARAFDMPGLSAERAPVFAAGVVILRAVFQALDLKRLQVSASGLREGILHDLLGRLRHEDAREQTVQALGSRYHIDTAQAERVARTVDECVAQVKHAWELDDDAARLLGWAARLHELGLAVAHSKYHHHGAYLLANSDLPGFAREQQQLLAVLVRSHRRRFPIEAFETLPRRSGKRARQMAAMLRLAVLLNRGRTDAPLPRARLRADKRRLSLRFPAGWLAHNPLTAADLAQEARYLRVAKLQLNFD
ncbi:MAG: exopolyphosphatase [Gammaproteobacteria bacterium]|nr:exopolyphosphatase [Gammaproteobacteria bacterium]